MEPLSHSPAAFFSSTRTSRFSAATRDSASADSDATHVSFFPFALRPPGPPSEGRLDFDLADRGLPISPSFSLLPSSSLPETSFAAASVSSSAPCESRCFFFALKSFCEPSPADRRFLEPMASESVASAEAWGTSSGLPSSGLPRWSHTRTSLSGILKLWTSPSSKSTYE